MRSSTLCFIESHSDSGENEYVLIRDCRRRAVPRISRRHYLHGLGVLVPGLVSGCSSDGGDGAVGWVDAPEEVAAYLSETSNFDGRMEDETDAERTLVDVGAVGNGDYSAFEPPALQVTPETTIAWHWTGRGGEHNIVEESDAFSSGDPISGSDETFERRIQEPGTYLYYCGQHESVGMKGAIVVVGPDA